jgi:Di-haem oxidoreductase, putative peroxidase
MLHRCLSVVVLFLGVIAAGLVGLAQDAPTEAPAGSDTPTLATNPGSQSHNNGLGEPAGDTYALDQSIFELDHDASTGLGPVFNPLACADCHQNPVSGGSSQFTEIRAGHLDANGNFVAATVPINDGANTIALRSIIVTNRLRPHDVTIIGKIITDPEDVPDSLGLADIDHFAQFIRRTKVPPRDTALAATADAQAGQALFDKIGCSTCHVSAMVTAPAGTVINGGTFAVPDALGNKIIHPYSDFLLHDIGTGDGIVQSPPEDTANTLRTVPLWGLRTHRRHMHDLKSLTLEDAIERHRGEAEHVAHRFRELSPTEKQQVITFLNSL